MLTVSCSQWIYFFSFWGKKSQKRAVIQVGKEISISCLSGGGGEWGSL